MERLRCDRTSTRKEHFPPLCLSDPVTQSSELGKYWLVPLLQSPFLLVFFFFFCFCSFLKSYLHRTQTIFLKASLSCLENDLDNELLEGIDFFPTFSFLFFFFDLSLLEDSPWTPLCSFMALSYSLWYPQPCNPTCLSSLWTFPSRSRLPSWKVS